MAAAGPSSASIAEAISMNDMTGGQRLPYVRCPLCGSNGPFAKSHIMSENLLKLGGSWLRPFLHPANTEILPASMGRKLFCCSDHNNVVSCEQNRFSPAEGLFKHDLVDPFLNSYRTSVSIKYGKWLFYNAASLAYRHLVAHSWRTASASQFRDTILQHLAGLSLTLKPYLLDASNYVPDDCPISPPPTHCSGIFVGLTAYDQSSCDLAYVGIAESTFCNVLMGGTEVAVGVQIMVYGLHLLVTSDIRFFDNVRNTAAAESYTFFDIDPSGGEFIIPALVDRKFHAHFCGAIDQIVDSSIELSAQHRGLEESDAAQRENDARIDPRITRNLDAALGKSACTPSIFRSSNHRVFFVLPPKVVYDRSEEGSHKLGCIRLLDGSGLTLQVKKYIHSISTLYVWYYKKARDKTNYAIVRVQEDAQQELVFCFKYRLSDYGTRCIFEKYLSERNINGLQPVKDAVAKDIIEDTCFD